MNYIQVLLLVLISFQSAFSQEQKWVDAETYGSGRLSYMESDGSSNYILVGEIGSQIENQTFQFPDKSLTVEDNSYIVILKVNSDFKILDYNYITGDLGAKLGSATVIKNHVYVSFHTTNEATLNTDSDTIHPKSDFASMVVCFDNDLNLVWSKETIDSDDCQTNYLHFCGTMGDKAIVSGSVTGFDVSQPSCTIDSTLIRSPDIRGRAFYFLVDSAGVISDLTYVGMSDNPYIRSIKSYDDNIYYIVDRTDERVFRNEELIYTGLVTPRYGQGTSLIKMDTTNNVEWMQMINLDGWGQSSITAIDIDEKENVLLAVGYSTINAPPNARSDRLYVGDSFISRAPLDIDEYANIGLAKLNSEGEVQWLKKLWSYGQQGVPSVYCKSANQYLVFGQSSERLIYDGDTLIHSKGVGSNAFILELDSNGKRISFEMLGGNGSTFASNMHHEENGDVIIAGNTYSGRVTFGDVKITVDDSTDPSTFFNWYIARKSAFGQNGGVPSNNPLAVNIYPNPANSYVQIDFPNESANKEILVYNQLGKKILVQNTTSSNHTIQTNQFASGIYYLTITTLQGSANFKLIVARIQ